MQAIPPPPPPIGGLVLVHWGAKSRVYCTLHPTAKTLDLLFIFVKAFAHIFHLAHNGGAAQILRGCDPPYNPLKILLGRDPLYKLF